jgi:hypothetical protein
MKISNEMQDELYNQWKLFAEDMSSPLAELYVLAYRSDKKTQEQIMEIYAEFMMVTGRISKRIDELVNRIENE